MYLHAMHVFVSARLVVTPLPVLCVCVFLPRALHAYSLYVVLEGGGEDGLVELVTKAMDVLTPYLHETDRQPACRSCTKEGHRGDFPSHSQPWSLCSLGSGMLVQVCAGVVPHGGTPPSTRVPVSVMNIPCVAWWATPTLVCVVRTDLSAVPAPLRTAPSTKFLLPTTALQTVSCPPVSRLVGFWGMPRVVFWCALIAIMLTGWCMHVCVPGADRAVRRIVCATLRRGGCAPAGSVEVCVDWCGEDGNGWPATPCIRRSCPCCRLGAGRSSREHMPVAALDWHHVHSSLDLCRLQEIDFQVS